MQPLSRFLVRNAHRFATGGATLCINPPADLPWRKLQVAGLRLFTQDHADLLRLRATGADIACGSFPEAGGDPPRNLLLSLPREKDRLRMWLHWCAGTLPADGRLWLAGENRAGIRSAGRHLEGYFGATVKVDNARHCVLYESRAPTPGGAFDPLDYLLEWDVAVADRALHLCSLPGVFSHGELDPGTRLLVDIVASREWTGEVLDFGCGNGVLGLFLKTRNPNIRLTLLDNNLLALAAARLTLARNGCSAEFRASDGFSDIEGSFDLIVSNPPFHQGVATTAHLSIGLLAPVRNFLRPGGQLLLVANRHLPYRRWLDETFGGHRVLAADRNYHVLHAVQS
jgi:16S rRNA (guanine1207-N2)-methyltransferase